MAWTTALSDSRMKLNDGPVDKIRAFKRVLGQIDGTNTRFKTFEFRRVTDFTTATGSLGVYVDQVLQSSGYIATDDPTSGYFTTVTAPSASSVVEATYYVQYFLDAEIQTFLRYASNWLGLGDDYTQIPGGLQAAAVSYVAAEGYQKLASRFSEHMSETFRLEDMPDVARQALIAEWKQASEHSRDTAHKLRDEFYTRQGQSLAPLFAVNRGYVPNVVPNR